MKNLVSLLTTLVIFSASTPAKAAEEKKHSEQTQSPMASAIMNKSGADFEAAYLGMMILHHQSGMPMWTMFREKGTNAELKGIEKKTTPKEQSEVEEMTGWLKKWHNKSPADFKMPEASMLMMEKDMAELKAVTGKEFDALFASEMKHHHMGAIEMAKLAEEKAEHAEVKAAAKTIVQSQTEDEEKLRVISKEAK